jgi:hypothetical protein
VHRARREYHYQSCAAADGAVCTGKAAQVKLTNKNSAVVVRDATRSSSSNPVSRRMETGDIPLVSVHAPGPAFASPQRPSTASSSSAHSAVLPPMHDVPGSGWDADVDKYLSEYRILSVRQRVLSNELLDIQAQIAQVMHDEYKVVCDQNELSLLCRQRSEYKVAQL